MTKNSWALALICFAFAMTGYSQEEEGYLLYNYEQIERAKLERDFTPRERSNTTLELPFGTQMADVKAAVQRVNPKVPTSIALHCHRHLNIRHYFRLNRHLNAQKCSP